MVRFRPHSRHFPIRKSLFTGPPSVVSLSGGGIGGDGVQRARLSSLFDFCSLEGQVLQLCQKLASCTHSSSSSLHTFYVLKSQMIYISRIQSRTMVWIKFLLT
ncbi:hypothetical protein GDO86_004126 [Hymenochirus boettgeri]|uniref:Uncharacterized protein n=1 Tax=Hymenochirus boettgeri TaxID=247094 RepID=A0A8T2K4K0_9PIPI|nr:hypothetical protein GDO86_004126 [Hymenochirus boettgeri]